MNIALRTRLVAAVGLAAAAMAAMAGPAHAVPIDVQIIDVPPRSPQDAITPSSVPSVSANGRYVAFSAGRVHVRDRVTGQDVFRSDGNGFTPVLSANGAVVAYKDVSGLIQAVDLATGVRQQVSRGLGGAAPNGPSANPDLSGDGRYVVFDSSASNLVVGDVLGHRDVFRFDRLTGATVVLSRTPSSFGNGDSARPSVSHDGSAAAFESDATSFDVPDTNARTDIYVRGANGAFKRASVSTAGAQANGRSTAPDLDAGGNNVVFETEATNLGPNDYTTVRDVYARSLPTGVTTRISLDAEGDSHSSAALSPSISADGRRIALRTENDYVAGDSNYLDDVYVVDLNQPIGSEARIRLVSRSHDDQSGDGDSIQPRLSGDGRSVVFASAASHLVADDPDGSRMDIFFRTL